jgi:hypothetical protein
MLPDFLLMVLVLAGLSAGVGLMFLLITRNVPKQARAPHD